MQISPKDPREVYTSTFSGRRTPGSAAVLSAALLFATPCVTWGHAPPKPSGEPTNGGAQTVQSDADAPKQASPGDADGASTKKYRCKDYNKLHNSALHQLEKALEASELKKEDDKVRYAEECLSTVDLQIKCIEEIPDHRCDIWHALDLAAHCANLAEEKELHYLEKNYLEKLRKKKMLHQQTEDGESCDIPWRLPINHIYYSITIGRQPESTSEHALFKGSTPEEYKGGFYLNLLKNVILPFQRGTELLTYDRERLKAVDELEKALSALVYEKNSKNLSYREFFQALSQSDGAVDRDRGRNLILLAVSLFGNYAGTLKPPMKDGPELYAGLAAHWYSVLVAKTALSGEVPESTESRGFRQELQNQAKNVHLHDFFLELRNIDGKGKSMNTSSQFLDEFAKGVKSMPKTDSYMVRLRNAVKTICKNRDTFIKVYQKPINASIEKIKENIKMDLGEEEKDKLAKEITENSFCRDRISEDKAVSH